MRRCPLTDSTDSSSFFFSPHCGIMTSDQRIIKGQLEKIIFNESGIVANKKSFNTEELNNLYGNEYELNTSGGEEHIFFTKEGPISRSQVYFNWIKPFIHDNFKTLIEIGCGEGNVLEKIAKAFPGKNILGFDGSAKAVELGKKKQLNISQKIFHENDLFPNADVYLLIGVLEHIEDIKTFLLNIISALNKNGKIIICIPIQDYGGYDIFFADHIWHFTIKQFELFLNKLNLKVLHVDSSHPVNYGFGLFVCEKGKASAKSLINDSRIMLNNLNHWQEHFIKINDFFNKNHFDKIAVFGASEIFTLFMAYSSLSDQNIVACIDDTKKAGSKKHGISIYNSEWLRNNRVDLLLLTVNRKYHEIIKEKLKDLNLNIQLIY